MSNYRLRKETAAPKKIVRALDFIFNLILLKIYFKILLKIYRKRGYIYLYALNRKKID